MMPFLLVAAGGAKGSVLHFAVQRWLNIQALSWGTLAVNLAGCFVIGCLWSMLSQSAVGQKQWLLMTSFCGGFTPFSALTPERITFINGGPPGSVFFIHICRCIRRVAGYIFRL